MITCGVINVFATLISSTNITRTITAGNRFARTARHTVNVTATIACPIAIASAVVCCFACDHDYEYESDYE